jgi:hypothetical protein
VGYFFVMSYNPCYLQRGSAIVVWVEGGVPPYTWAIKLINTLELEDTFSEGGDVLLEDGTDVLLENSNPLAGPHFTFDDAVTTVQYNILRADSTQDTGYYETIVVTDSCGTEVSMDIYLCDTAVCCDDPAYDFDYDMHSVNFLWRGTYGIVSVTGGCPPFHWEVTGSDFEFGRAYTNQRDNVIYLNAGTGAVATAVISVTDECGNVVGNGDLVGLPVTGAPAGITWTVPAGYIAGDDAAADGGCGNTDYDFYWDPSNPTDLDTPGSTVISIVGGRSPFWWMLSGTGGWSWEEGGSQPFRFSVNTGGGDFATVYGDETACDQAVIGVVDRCLKLITAGPGLAPWFWYLQGHCCCDDVHDLPSWDSENPETIGPDHEAVVVVNGGCGPFEWEVNGSGFWLDAGYTTTYATTDTGSVTVYSDGACGTCSVLCVDDCKDSVTGYLRCTDGDWVEKPGGCVLSGSVPYYSTDGLSYNYELIEGYQKQYQWTYYRRGSLYYVPCSAYPSFCAAWSIPPQAPNCIDGDHTFPCTDGSGPSIACYHVRGLIYYEWEC